MEKLARLSLASLAYIVLLTPKLEPDLLNDLGDTGILDELSVWLEYLAEEDRRNPESKWLQKLKKALEHELSEGNYTKVCGSPEAYIERFREVFAENFNEYPERHWFFQTVRDVILGKAQPHVKEEKCRYCGATDIAYRDGEIAACSKCYKKIIMIDVFLELSNQTSVSLEEKQVARFPETLYTADFGTFSLSRIEPNGEAVYLGNELNTQGYEIRLADMGDYFAGLRNFQVSDDDDFLSNFDENGKEII